MLGVLQVHSSAQSHQSEGHSLQTPVTAQRLQAAFKYSTLKHEQTTEDGHFPEKTPMNVEIATLKMNVLRKIQEL